jgi:hypothetical protein
MTMAEKSDERLCVMTDLGWPWTRTASFPKFAPRHSLRMASTIGGWPSRFSCSSGETPTVFQDAHGRLPAGLSDALLEALEAVEKEMSIPSTLTEESRPEFEATDANRR